MITLTRQLARQVHDVGRRGLPKPPHGERPPVHLQSGPDGLRLRSWSPTAAIEYHVPRPLEPEQLVIPLDAFKACAGSRTEPVTIERADNNQVILRWSDLGIPQVAAFDVPESDGQFPSLPERMQYAGPRILQALRDALDTTDADCHRYAFNCLRLRGALGRIDATDSRQALVQAGYSFPWMEDLLVPADRVFKAAVFSDAPHVEIGRAADWITFRIGAWTIHLAINKEGRFPDIDGCIPAPSTARSRLRLSESDARFLERALSRLPSDAASNGGVTVDLNGAILVRARSQQNPIPTELVLRASSRSGDEICLNTSRVYLERAVRLGFRELGLVSADAPVVCHDRQRTYVWALLSQEGIVQPAEHAERVESPSVQPVRPAGRAPTRTRGG